MSAWRRALLLGALMLAGCGQMGPLVLPGEAGQEAPGQADSGQADPAQGASGDDGTEEQDEGGAEQ